MRWAGLIGAVLPVIMASGCAGIDHYKEKREAVEAKLIAAGFKVHPTDGSFPRLWKRVGPDMVRIEQNLSGSTYFVVAIPQDHKSLRCNDITDDPPARIEKVKELGVDAAIAEHSLKCVLP